MALLLCLESPSSRPRPLPVLFSSGNGLLEMQLSSLWKTFPLVLHAIQWSYPSQFPSPSPASGHRGGQAYQSETVIFPHLPTHSEESMGEHRVQQGQLFPGSRTHVWRGSLHSTDWLSQGYGSLKLLMAIFPDLTKEAYE